MSEELHDLRAKITTETDLVLQAEHLATRRDKSEIVREILHEWAAKRIEVAKVTVALLRTEGMIGRRREEQDQDEKTITTRGRN